MKEIRESFLIFLLLLALVLAGCSKSEKGDERPHTVVIYNLMSHPILDASASGIKSALIDEGVKVIELSANGDISKVSAFAIEALNTKPDVIVPISTPVAQAVIKEAPASQKIVFSTVTNPSDVGLDKKPKNVTGVSDVVNFGANFDLIFELFPKTKMIGIPYNAGERNSQFGVDQIRALADKRGIKVQLVTVASSQEVVDAARSLLDKVDVIYVGSDNTVVGAMAGLIKISREKRVPVIASDSGSVQEGALAAISVDYEQLGRRAGRLVSEILKSNKMPGEIQPIRFMGDTLILNNRAAQALGYEFPAAIRARAQKIIE
jgi:putative tryptophan/tyrosine transport system substrate-binding protein